MRLRIRFAKLGKVRWTSHRDVARMWERAFRRTGVSVAYTLGFSPRPKISFGLALPTGHESRAEYLDVDLAEPVEPDLVIEVLSDALPVGVDAIGAGVVTPGAGSLQEEVTSCTWTVHVLGASSTGMQALAATAMAAESLVVTRTRKGREVTDDLRAALRHATATETPHGAALELELLTQPRGVRPAELLTALDPTIELGTVCRLHQWIERGGARYEPLDAARPPCAEVRAS